MNMTDIWSFEIKVWHRKFLNCDVYQVTWKLYVILLFCGKECWLINSVNPNILSWFEIDTSLWPKKSMECNFTLYVSQVSQQESLVPSSNDCLNKEPNFSSYFDVDGLKIQILS